MAFTLGCDPEFFLVNEKGDFVPAFDTVGGSKQVPRVLPSGHTVQEDGCAVEIGIIPAESAAQFKQHIKEALADVKAILKPLGLSPMFVSQAEFKQEYMQDHRAWAIGCDPDYDAYAGKKRTLPEYEDLVRYAGGHIHIGSDALLNPKVALDAVKALDVTVGYHCAMKDTNTRRSKVYGGPGKFRFKPYGIEYRSPSNVWLVDTKLQEYIFRQCSQIVAEVSHGVDRRAIFAVQTYTQLVESMTTGARCEYFDHIERYL